METVGRDCEDDDSKLPDAIKPDKFGFLLQDHFHASLEVAEDVLRVRRAKDLERSMKWARMIRKWDFVDRHRKTKLEKRVIKGVPESARGFAWWELSGAKEYQKKYPNYLNLPVDSVNEITVDEVAP
jgi:hypothetical protein